MNHVLTLRQILFLCRRDLLLLLREKCHHAYALLNAFQIQDFRFLCPNGTAFDQEAQICADWGDVDCEAATLYYGSDNFDLYRIGSNFESKKSKFAEEDESVFHLQHAETSLNIFLLRMSEAELNFDEIIYFR